MKKLLLAFAVFAFLCAAQAKADEPAKTDTKPADKPMKKAKKGKKKKAKKEDTAAPAK
jgi:ABC-type transporter MlaC component